MSKFINTIIFLFFLILTAGPTEASNVDTGQESCYGNNGRIDCPRPGQSFYGQDAQYAGQAPRYRDNRDGTTIDLNTGLMWSKGLDGRKVKPEEGERIADKMNLGGHSDWRVPTIKELYSLIDFRGSTGSPGRSGSQSLPRDAVPYINTDYFDFAYGDTASGERFIDAQWLSATRYVSTTMNGMDTVFGVNFADGRIKGYGYRKRGTKTVRKTFYARYVRGPAYGRNDFVDNNDGTVTDLSTGLMWTKGDSGRGMNWREALAYAKNLSTGGHNDWRVPNAKELQYIVDYSRSPDTTKTPAIDPVFETTVITNEGGQRDFPFFWTSTTHLDGPRPGQHAIYVAFGRAMGRMRGRTMDVHGAGAQRSDLKKGIARLGHGPQGDAQRVKNYVRCVRGGAVARTVAEKTGNDNYPDKIRLVKVDHDSGLATRANARSFSARVSYAGMGRFVSRLDRDGDGRVSRSEFDGPPARFDVYDTNHDGYLSEEEAPRRRGRRP